ncbi:LbetaH domain-containing protein [Arthrobacter sp. MDT1-65]
MEKLSADPVHHPVPRVINLADAPGERQAWGRPAVVVYAWSAIELLLVHNPWQISSAVRVAALRAFGAVVGEDVLIRPRTRFKFPWKLSIGDRSWVGEGAWIHNQDQVTIGADVVISQEAFITTGSHAVAADMALITRPVEIKDGAWIATRAMILGGTTIGRSVVVAPNIVIPPNSDIQAESVIGLPTPKVTRKRFHR